MWDLRLHLQVFQCLHWLHLLNDFLMLNVGSVVVVDFLVGSWFVVLLIIIFPIYAHISYIGDYVGIVV